LRWHPAFGRLWPLLNRKILDVAQLRLRFCSIFATKSVSKSGAIPKRLIYGQALILPIAEYVSFPNKSPISPFEALVTYLTDVEG
jgi:hypothetical protein